MLTPIEMLAKKNRLPTRMLLGLLFALLFAGCMAPGPRALLSGKKQLDAGDYAAAVESFRAATTLLPANAAAWNYLGVAYQKSQQPDSVANAAAAYQRALSLDRDLVEAHWNLGMLWLEQSKNDQAVAEFTAYTLRRSNNPDGWLKLGAAQLRLGEIVPAEASFSWVQNKLDPNNAEALNGLGLARLERNRPRDAVLFFAAAVQWHPGYASAMLNLAVTAQEYLHDNRTALQYYRAYLELTPRPDNWEDVSEIANTLEQGMVVAAVPPPPPPVNPAPVQTLTQPLVQPQPQPAEIRRPPPVAVRQPQYAYQYQNQKPQPAARANPAPVTYHPAPPPAAPVVKRQPSTPAQPVAAIQPKMASVDNSQAQPPADATAPAKPSFWDKLKPTHWFAPTAVDKKYENAGLTPLPAGDSASGPTPATPAAEPAEPATPLRPVNAAPSAAPAFARYGYLAPGRPAEGDRRGASGAFTRARVLEQASQWMEAMQAYHTATELDPSWFEAQYNFGVLSYRLGDQHQALSAYETALAIQPDSVDARYNFALALKAAGYVPDAVNELKKVLAANPNEVRAHLALANLYAQKLHDPVQAREHYLKVLDLDPNNPQAADIRYWLSANSE